MITTNLDLTRFDWNGNPQPATPQEQAPIAPAQSLLIRSNSPQMDLSENHTSLTGRVTPRPSFEEHKQANSGEDNEIDVLITVFEQALKVGGSDNVDEIQDAGVDLSLAQLTDGQIKKLTTIQLQALNQAARNGGSPETLLSLVRFSPVPLTIQSLNEITDTASDHGHLPEIYTAYLDTIKDLARESMIEQIIQILPALKHAEIPSRIQKEAITEALCAALLEEEKFLSDVLGALDGFSPDTLVDPIGTALTEAKKSKLDPQRQMLQLKHNKLKKSVMKSTRLEEMRHADGNKRPRN